MSIFKSILEKIFPSSHAAPAPAATPAEGSAVPGAAAPAAPAAAAPVVDVEAVLAGLQAKHPEKLNWKVSIVDLLKLLGLDSSLAARRQLAAELSYSGSTDDSAALNIWLHKQVLAKLEANGGKLPDDLKR